MAVPLITNEEAREIKARIWAGEQQRSIAADFAVTTAAISHIAQGRRFYEVQWPDGTVGPLPRTRAVEIHRNRYAAVRAGAVVQQLAKLPSVSPAALARALHDVAAETELAGEEHLVEAVKDVGESPERTVEPEQRKSKQKSPQHKMAPLEKLREVMEGHDFLQEAEKNIDLMNAARLVLAELPESQITAATVARLARNIVNSKKRES